MPLAVQVLDHPYTIAAAYTRPRAHFTGLGSILVKRENRSAHHVLSTVCEPVFGTISATVEEALEKLHQLPQGKSVVETAKRLASQAFAPGETPRPIRIALAQLTASLPEHFITHELSKEAVDYVIDKGTQRRLHGLPLLFGSPWILEVAQPGHENLIGDTFSLAGYQVGDDIVLMGFCRPDTIRVAVWRMPLEVGIVNGEYGLIPELKTDASDEVMNDWFSYSSGFALAFGALLEREAPVVQIRESEEVHRRQTHSMGGEKRSVDRVRWVYLDRQFRSTRQTKSPIGLTHETVQNPNLTEGTVTVRGHRRRQVCGPGNKLRKWVDVDPYQQKHMVRPGKQTKGITVAGSGLSTRGT